MISRQNTKLPLTGGPMKARLTASIPAGISEVVSSSSGLIFSGSKGGRLDVIGRRQITRALPVAASVQPSASIISQNLKNFTQNPHLNSLKQSFKGFKHA